jgi:hypothetical protein
MPDALYTHKLGASTYCRHSELGGCWRTRPAPSLSSGYAAKRSQQSIGQSSIAAAVAAILLMRFVRAAAGSPPPGITSSRLRSCSLSGTPSGSQMPVAGKPAPVDVRGLGTWPDRLASIAAALVRLTEDSKSLSTWLTLMSRLQAADLGCDNPEANWTTSSRESGQVKSVSHHHASTSMLRWRCKALPMAEPTWWPSTTMSSNQHNTCKARLRERAKDVRDTLAYLSLCLCSMLNSGVETNAQCFRPDAMHTRQTVHASANTDIFGGSPTRRYVFSQSGCRLYACSGTPASRRASIGTRE